MTSVTPTVTAINLILERFGFTGFKLAENPETKGTYRILRPDGSDAKKTLSEGEHNFIAFLYFFHLVYGSFKRVGITQNKVVVIDDPISSLDSNVLFIITTLVKTILTDCIDEQQGIKQVFVLTHNVYFHKEVTFRGSRSKYPTNKTRPFQKLCKPPKGCRIENIPTEVFKSGKKNNDRRRKSKERSVQGVFEGTPHP